MSDLKSRTSRRRTTIPAPLISSTREIVSCISPSRQKQQCSPTCSRGQSLGPGSSFLTTVVGRVSGTRINICYQWTLTAARQPGCFAMSACCACCSSSAPTADAAQSAQFAGYVAALGYTLIGVEEYGKVSPCSHCAQLRAACSCACSCVHVRPAGPAERTLLGPTAASTPCCSTPRRLCLPCRRCRPLPALHYPLLPSPAMSPLSSASLACRC